MELREAIRRLEDAHQSVLETHAQLARDTRSVEKDIVEVRTTLKFHNVIATATLGFLGWSAITLFDLNSTVARLDTSAAALTRAVIALQADQRDLRGAVDGLQSDQRELRQAVDGLQVRMRDLQGAIESAGLSRKELPAKR